MKFFKYLKEDESCRNAFIGLRYFRVGRKIVVSLIFTVSIWKYRWEIVRTDTRDGVSKWTELYKSLQINLNSFHSPFLDTDTFISAKFE